MAHPLLIDTDMGVDDAVALSLALASDELRLAGIVSVGGNVSLSQATDNVGRLLHALRPADLPAVSSGLDQADSSLSDASHVFGEDGLGNTQLPLPSDWKPPTGLDLYGKLVEKHRGELIVVAIGPLTNLAALLAKHPDWLRSVSRIVIMGGAAFGPIPGVHAVDHALGREVADQRPRDPQAAIRRRESQQQEHDRRKMANPGRLGGTVIARSVRAGPLRFDFLEKDAG